MITRTVQSAFPAPFRPTARPFHATAQPAPAAAPSHPAAASPNTRQDPLLEQAARSQNDLRDVLGLLGWDDLPVRLLLAVFDDLTAFALELKGEYASVCPFVRQRRKSVDHWIACWKEGLCSLDTAVQALQPVWEGEGAGRATLHGLPVGQPMRDGSGAGA